MKTCLQNTKIQFLIIYNHNPLLVHPSTHNRELYFFEIDAVNKETHY